MVNKVEITPSRIITRDNSGNTTFDTNNLYLKTDPTGSMKLGGFNRLPVYFCRFYYTQSGSLIDHVALGGAATFVEMSHPNQKVLNPGVAGSYTMYLPSSGVSDFVATGTDTRGIPGQPVRMLEWHINMGNVQYKKNWGDSWTTLGTNVTYFRGLLTFINNQGGAPIFTVRTISPDPLTIKSYYNTKGEGYYKVNWLPSNWQSGSFSAIYKMLNLDNAIASGPSSVTVTLSEYLNNTQLNYVVGGLVYPVISKPSTTIGLSVTP